MCFCQSFRSLTILHYKVLFEERRENSTEWNVPARIGQSMDRYSVLIFPFPSISKFVSKEHRHSKNSDKNAILSKPLLIYHFQDQVANSYNTEDFLESDFCLRSVQYKNAIGITRTTKIEGMEVLLISAANRTRSLSREANTIIFWLYWHQPDLFGCRYWAKFRADQSYSQVHRLETVISQNALLEVCLSLFCDLLRCFEQCLHISFRLWSLSKEVGSWQLTDCVDHIIIDLYKIHSCLIALHNERRNIT